MALKKIRLGDYLIPFKEKCGISNLTPYEISGVNKNKEFFEPSRQTGEDTTNYQNVPPCYFACNLMHVGRDCVLPIAYNHTNTVKHVSPAYSIFRIKDNPDLLEYYFFIYLKSNERDRYFWFNTDGSVRDGMSWEDLCNVELNIPSRPIQQKYVDVYNAMLANQRSYEKGLNDLKLVCDAYIENLFKNKDCFPVGNYIKRRMEKNTDFSVSKLLGVGMNGFITPKQEKDETNGHICYLIKKNDIVFAPPQIHKGSIDLYRLDEPAKCSDAYIVFYRKSNKILIDYIYAILKTPFFQKYAYYYRDGVREQFDFEQLSEFEIPIPSIDIQNSIIDILNSYLERKKMNENLKIRLKDICPILIKGSIEEARKEA